jgi:ATP-binding cassette subfamily B protein
MISDSPGARSNLTVRGGVEFDRVTFSYSGEAQDPVLREISFRVEPGETVALLGATGSGKSTLVHLLPRFYDVTGGRILLDGIDIRDLALAELRRHLAITMQETFLFSGTIRDNIAYGRPEALEEEIIAAAQAAQAHDFITALPDGYGTLLGQRGVNLSGGQKQRLAIARALVARPVILILDDSTSAVDLETEARLQAALAEWAYTPTRFIIAQRISTVFRANRILLLDDGRLVAQGKHPELLESCPLYRDLVHSQLGTEEMVDG